MFAIAPPSRTRLEFLRTSQHGAPLSYEFVGTTLDERPVCPPGFVVDHTRSCLGHGRDCYERAREALCRWQVVDLGWIQPLERDLPIVRGNSQVTVARSLGLSAINVTRIVGVIGDEPTSARFGFAYGTTALHVECGEERFLVEWNVEDDSVWFDILAISRPAHWLARLGYLWTRHCQKRFGRDSHQAMQRTTAPDSSGLLLV